MTAAGIIFSNLHDKNIADLTRVRTMASVPFGCRYRLVDFPLSNMVNAGITNVSVITHYNYLSLMDHIGSGKDWDLARRTGGIRILAPYITAYANYDNRLYNTHLEALMSMQYSIAQLTEDYVVLSDCDGICNIDFADMIAAHARNGADLTMAVKRITVTPANAEQQIIVSSNENGEMTDLLVHPNTYPMGEADVNINIWVVNREYLQSSIMNAQAHGFDSFSRDIIQRNIGRHRFFIYRFDGYYASINSMTDYYNHSMELLRNAEVREDLFHNPNRPILTKVRNSPPTRHHAEARVTNSLIADGCVIEGTVENSILFRGVKVGKGSVVRNSILFMDSYVGQNAFLNCVIADKHTSFRDGVMLSGHPELPFYIEKGKSL